MRQRGVAPEESAWHDTISEASTQLKGGVDLVGHNFSGTNSVQGRSGPGTTQFQWHQLSSREEWAWYDTTSVAPTQLKGEVGLVRHSFSGTNSTQGRSGPGTTQFQWQQQLKGGVGL
eukprot:1157632-Pelagomonas_calceolata.AAC.6